ncbi:MAG: radical SAM family heme chaperone HemW [Pseudomonadota bacterium]|nr:radical SAM family heme chaperone HemW [Pseudomonadota bacterium]MEC8102117.1 radical SAM family heme chaperone HemW [Pseudomonadota bacterium]
MSVLPPLSLYIHVPWCVRKCPYCDFNSHESQGDIPEADYITALIEDLKQDLHWVQGREIQSIFFGGGTPSLLSARAYDTLFDGLTRHLSFNDNIEITLEANPGTFEAEKFNGYRRAGINRLSMGIQSFDPEQLKKLGRIHDKEQALRAIDMARDAGFDNFNLDLMHGLPDQTPEQALLDLDTALAFHPPHLSWYQLTIEPNTDFYKRPPVLPEDDILWDIQEQGQARLAEAGLKQYEISAYARPGRQARHNINYWRFGDYLGIGAGAHGKITIAGPEGHRVLRSQKARLPKRYLDETRQFLSATDIIASDDIAFECMMNALRLHSGISITDFEQRTGVTLDSLSKPMQKAESLGLIERAQVNNQDYIRASERGKQYLNELLSLFLTD